MDSITHLRNKMQSNMVGCEVFVHVGIHHDTNLESLFRVCTNFYFVVGGH